jgi:hypothetical protein
MSFSSLYYLSINVPYVHLLPEHATTRGLLAPQKRSRIPGMLPFVWKPATIRFQSASTSCTEAKSHEHNRKPVDLKPVSVNARRMIHLYLSNYQESFDSCTCGRRDWNMWERYHAWISMNDQWHVGQDIMHVVLQESFVILLCMPVWEYVVSD